MKARATMNGGIKTYLAIPLMLTGACHAPRTGAAPSPQQHAVPQEREDSTYIPKDLADCFAELKTLLDPNQVQEIKSGTEDDMIQYHFGLGMWLRNNWGLWRGSRLASWFDSQGIQHPDDMSGIILDSFWRHLNDKPINLDEQVKLYQEYWEEQEKNEAVLSPGSPANGRQEWQGRSN